MWWKMSLFKEGRDTTKFKCLKSLLSCWQLTEDGLNSPIPSTGGKKKFSVEAFKTIGILKLELNVYYEIVPSLWGWNQNIMV